MCPDVPRELLALPLLRPEDVAVVWIMDWFDGPLVMLVLLPSGAPGLALLHDRDAVLGTDRPWRWVVHELTPEQAAAAERDHRAFAHHVGTTWCAHGGGHDPLDEPPDRERYFAAPRDDAWQDPARLRRVGWLADMPSLRRPVRE